ncbi:ABC transporter permease [Chitinophaga horti]|uniref:ABC transporter permease n=1 Tax=Chitinophaga horti TaxID=2920382 RepID=A0ABY6J499_9BACT|nr:ABC transporter permease [Chitinophaga horti]UYQ93032.1 ABC transporter permease [Chitinophaga horti]
MFANYLKLAWRNIWKSKGTFAINVIGLAVAVCVALLLSVTAYFQFSFNNFHKELGSLYQIYHEENEVNGPNAKSNLPVPLQDEMKREFPEVLMSTRYIGGGASYRYGTTTGSMGIRFVDPDFLDMFTFPIISGSKRPLDQPGNIVFSDKAALKWLGSADVVGKQVSIKFGDKWDNFTIAAVVQAAPANSDLDFGALMRFEHLPAYEQHKSIWDHYNTEMFVKLSDKATIAGFEKHSQSIVNKYYQDNVARIKRDGGKPNADGYLKKFSLIPVRDMHFISISASGGDVKKALPYMLIVIAAFVLFIACINFINLSVARAFGRAKEVGMRKMMGAVRFQLVLQLWGEALMICLVALIVGGIITYLVIPSYSAWLHTSVNMAMIFRPEMLLGIIAAFLVMTIVAGVYPALVMTRIDTVQALKGSVKPGRKQPVRNSLIVVQFAFSSLLICCTLVALQQISYLRSKPLGYNKQQVISLPLAGGDIHRGQLINLLRDRLSGEPGILSFSAADNNLGLGLDRSSMTSSVTFDYKEREINTNLLTVDYDYTQTIGIQLVAGRDFDRRLASDSTAIVINEEMAKRLGGNNVLNQFIKFDDEGDQHQVIGIMKNYHFQSLAKKIDAITLRLDPTRVDYAYGYIKVSPNDLPASLGRVEKVWSQIQPGVEFKGSFLDENVDRMYNEEKRTSQLLVAGAIVTIIISCMGLFAMAILSIAQRTKEIGIRKVLGSSISAIVVLLYRDFLKLVVIAIFIAVPLAWYGMGAWLNSFAYNVGLQWWVFAVAGLCAVIVALVTVSVQSIRAALANPVKSLRSE